MRAIVFATALAMLTWGLPRPGLTQQSHVASATAVHEGAGGDLTCAAYLDSFGQATLIDQKVSGPPQVWQTFGEVNSLITFWQHNRGAKRHAIVYNDVYRWVATWCEPRPEKEVRVGVLAYFLNLE